MSVLAHCAVQQLPGRLQRAGHSSCVWGENIVLFGGRSGYGASTVFYSDLWSYNTATRQWRCLCEEAPFAARANHTATVVGDELWVAGGSNTAEVFGDVRVYHLRKREWSTPVLRGSPQLLQRTAHGACVHPLRGDTILFYAGYGCPDPGAPMQWLSDLVALNTLRKDVAAVDVHGAAPEGRGYHTFNAVGQRCYAIGGRTTQNKHFVDQEVVAVFDAAVRKWLPQAAPSGASLGPRSSHRVVVLGPDLLVFGGANAAGRLSDLYCLSTDLASTRLVCQDWTPALSAAAAAVGGPPEPRAACAMELVGSSLFIIGGYGNGKSYVADLWRLDVAPSPPPDAPAPPAREKDGCARASGEASQWRQRRGRSTAFVEALGPNKRQRAGGSGKTPEKGAGPLLGGRSPAKGLAAAGPAHAAAASSEPEAEAAEVAPLQRATAPAAVAPAAYLPRSGCAAPALAAEMAQLRVDVEGRQEEELAALRREVAALTGDKARLNSELAIAAGNARDAARDRDEFKAALEEERESSKVALARARQQAAEELHQQAVAFSHEREAAAAVAREKDATISRLEAEQESLRATARRERTDWEQSYQAKQRHVEDLSLDLSIARENNNRMTEQLCTAGRQAEQLRTQLEEEQKAHAATRREAAEERERLLHAAQVEKSAAELAKMQHDAVRAQLATAEEAARSAQAEASQLRARVTELEERAQRGEAEAARLQLDNARLRAESGRLQDGLRLARPEYEQALQAAEAALGQLRASGAKLLSSAPD